MKAIILAGGRGKRLRPITDYVPKPLVPLNNVPIIEWQIRYLKQFNVDEIIICTGYKTEMIEHFLETKDNFGIKIKFSIEKTPLGTGGAIKQAGKSIKDKSFFVINGDTITDIDLRKLEKSLNSIAAIELRTKFGIMETEDNKVTKFREKKEISNVWMNAGIYHSQVQCLKTCQKKVTSKKQYFQIMLKKEH
jgi:NDP-sugar pyrophosphorylase family protein